MGNDVTKTIVLLDGNSLMFRAYYATAYTGNLMQTKDGIYTNALYGFINMLSKIIDTFDCTYMLIAFDKGKKTFRHQALDSYKGTRKHMPEELAMQIPLIKEYLDLCNIKRLELDDYEADDIVGSMSKKAVELGFKAICISGDKDLLQLVDNNCDVLLTKKGVSDLDEYTIDNFKEKMGFYSTQMVDYKAMIGDSSDNLEGVRGIGPKTAITLLNKYDNLDNIYDSLDELTPKVQEAFKQYKETCLQTRFLATIYKGISFDFGIEDCLVKSPDYIKLRKFLEGLEFSSIIKKLDIKSEYVQEVKDTKTYNKYIDSRVEEMTSLVNEHKYMFFDIELDQDNYHLANILGASVVVENDAFFFSNINEIKELLENEEIEKYSIDSKKNIVTCLKLGINIKNIKYDAMVAIYLINPSFISQDIKTTFENIEPNNLKYIEEIYSKKTKHVVPLIDIYANYSMDKVITTSNTKDEILKQLDELKLNDLYYEVELKLLDVLANMEYSGFKINQDRLKEIGAEFKTKIEEVESEIYKLIGKEFNIASPKQLGIILFDELKLAKGKKNKTGYSTSAEILESMIDLHPVIPLILEYRKYTKLYSTYVVGLFDSILEDGKVHTIFKQTLTQTGRLSSIEPNIQNIPIRTEDGRIIRSAFVPSTVDGLLISADYSQIELRILAEMSECKSMIEDFNNGLDMHTSTASKINNVGYDEVTKDMRRMAKAVNFGIIYGMSDWGLADTLQLKPIDARIFIDKYFSIYPEIKDYLSNLVKDATEKGYTLTMFNRRRYIPELSSSNYALRQFGERTSMNAPIQGSAADIIKMAMVKVFFKMKELNLHSRMIVQVHDEIIIDTIKEEEQIVKKILKEEMENVYPLKVKLTVDIESGPTWDLK